MSKQLNQTTRHIAYLCSWPYYLLLNGHLPPWDEIRRRCNMWRVADDVNESLGSILNIIATYERLQVRITDAWFGRLRTKPSKANLGGVGRNKPALLLMWKQNYDNSGRLRPHYLFQPTPPCCIYPLCKIESKCFPSQLFSVLSLLWPVLVLGMTVNSLTIS